MRAFLMSLLGLLIIGTVEAQTHVGDVGVVAVAISIIPGHTAKFRISRSGYTGGQVKVPIAIHTRTGLLRNTPPTEAIIRSGSRSVTVSIATTSSIALDHNEDITLSVFPSETNQYEVGVPATASVIVRPIPVTSETIPRISWSYTEATDQTVYEGEAAYFQLNRADANGNPLTPGYSVTVNISWSNSARDFVDSGNLPRTITIGAHAASAFIEVPTTTRTSASTRNGTLRATISSRSSVYRLESERTKTVEILSRNAQRQFRLRRLSSATITEGGTIRGRVYRVGDSTEPLTIPVWINENHPQHNPLPDPIPENYRHQPDRKAGTDSVNEYDRWDEDQFASRFVRGTGDERHLSRPDHVSVVIPANRSYVDFSLRTVNDETHEADGVLVFSLGSDQAGSTDNRFEVTVRDNDSAVVYLYQAVEFNDAHEQGSVTFRIERSRTHYMPELQVEITFETEGAIWNSTNRPPKQTVTFPAQVFRSQGIVTSSAEVTVQLPSDTVNSGLDSKIRARISRILTPDTDYIIKPRYRVGVVWIDPRYSQWVNIIDEDIDLIHITGSDTVREGRRATFALNRRIAAQSSYEVTVYYVVNSPAHPEKTGRIDVNFPRGSRRVSVSIPTINDVYAFGNGYVHVGLEPFYNIRLATQINQAKTRRVAEEVKRDAEGVKRDAEVINIGQEEAKVTAEKQAEQDRIDAETIEREANGLDPIVYPQDHIETFSNSAIVTANQRIIYHTSRVTYYTGRVAYYQGRIDTITGRIGDLEAQRRDSREHPNYYTSGSPCRQLNLECRGFHTTYPTSFETVVIDDETVSRLPVVSISVLGSSNIQEGTPARFRATRSSTPTANPLDISLWINETGDMYGNFCRVRNHDGFDTDRPESREIRLPPQIGPKECLIYITIPAGRSYVDFAVPTYQDNVQELDSVITVDVAPDFDLYFRPGSRSQANVTFRNAGGEPVHLKMELLGESTIPESQPAQVRITRLSSGANLAIQVKIRVTGEGASSSPPTLINLPYAVDSVDFGIPTIRNGEVLGDLTKIMVQLLDDEGRSYEERENPATAVNQYEIRGGVRKLEFTLTNADPYIAYGDSREVSEGGTFATWFSLWSFDGLGDDDVFHVIHETISGGTATPGVDYTPVSPTAYHYTKNSRSANPPVVTLADSVDDAGETIMVKYSSPADSPHKVKFCAPSNPGCGASGPFVDSVTLTLTITNEGILPKAWVAEFSHSSGTVAVGNIKDRLDSRRGNGVWVKANKDTIDGSEIRGTNYGGIVGYDEGTEEVVLGVAFAGNEATGRFEDYELEGQVSTAYVYGQYQPHERVSVWGAVGYGIGEINISNEDFDDDADLYMQVQAVGADVGLVATEKVDLGVSTKSTWVQAESANTRDYRSSETDSYRHEVELGFEYHLTERVSATAALGYEQIGGDVENSEGKTGSVGIIYTDERLELGISTTIFEDYEPEVALAYNSDAWRAEVVVAGTDQLTISGGFSYDLDGDQRGLVLKLQPEFAEESVLETRLGYGFMLGTHEILQPYLGLTPERAEIGIDYLAGLALFSVVIGEDRSIMLGIRRNW